MVFKNQSLQKDFRFLRNDKVNVDFNFISRLLRRYAPRNDKKILTQELPSFDEEV